MKEIRIKFSTICKILIVFLACVYVFLYSSVTNFSSIDTYLSILVMFVNTMIFLLSYKRTLKNKSGIITLLILLASLTLGLLSDKNDIKTQLLLVNLVITLLYCSEQYLNERDIKYLSGLMLLLFILFNFTSKIGFNENTIGYIFFISLPFIHILLKKSNLKKGIYKVVLLAVTVYIAYGIYDSKCRSALYAFILYWIVYMLVTKFKDKKKFWSVFCSLLLIGCILFPLLYVGMWRNNIDIKLPFTNKQLYTGREEIWYNALQLLKGNLLTGVGYNYVEILNTHNSLMYILLIYGIVNLTLILLLFFKCIKKIVKKLENDDINRIGFSGFVANILIAYFETNLIWNKEAIFIILLLVFCFYDKGLIQAKKEERSGKINGSNTGI